MSDLVANPQHPEGPVTSIRSIGLLALTGLVINCIIGSAIFGLPSVLSRMLGTASPLAMLAAALLMSIIVACAIEVASHFSETGGAYLYGRTVLGRFAGVQIGWFWLLSAIGGGAVNANLLTFYLSGLWPDVGQGWIRWATMAVLIAIPGIANHLGVRQGAIFSSILVTAKMLPLVVLIGLGLLRFVEHGWVLPSSAVAVDSGSGAWLDALLLLVAAYGGWDLALAPTGEIKRAAQTIPIALGSGLAVAAALYALTQFVTLATIGTSPTDRPVAEAASVLIGPAGALFVTVAVMLSTYGNISACILNAPRIIYALAANGDAPAAFGKLHSQFRTPALAIVVYTLFVWLLAASGTFVWALALGAGSLTILYGSICACLFKLPRLKPHRKRVPAQRILATLGIAISALLLTRLQAGQLLLMGVTAMGATASWWWATRGRREP